MTKIISFISRKGGTGKTTVAMNLATMLFNLGHKLAMLETDTNYTLNTLRQMEVYKSGAKDESLFKILGSTDQKVIDDLEKLRKENKLDFILVDSAGKTTDSNIKKLCIESDLVVIPTSLTQNDLLVTYQTVEDIKPAQEINNKLKIAILANRIHSSTKQNTIESALDELKVTILNEYIPMKNIFANFSTILPEKQFLPVSKAILSTLEK
ncbi:MAG: AAA family ATPase [Cyclobacteriaceae bacterium]